MKKYTVMLLRPDYITDDFGRDRYLAHVVAASPSLAVGKAQMEAWVTDNGGPDFITDDAEGDEQDYYVLCVFEGHLNDLTGETT